jgi:hypothetical protein
MGPGCTGSPCSCPDGGKAARELLAKYEVCEWRADCECYTCTHGRARSWRSTAIVLALLVVLQTVAWFRSTPARDVHHEEHNPCPDGITNKTEP